MINRTEKHIALLISELTIGGAEIQCIMLARALKDTYPVDLIVLKGHLVENKYKELIHKENIRLILLKGFLIYKLFRLFRLFVSNRYRILFCYLPADNIWGTLTGRIAGIKYIIGGIRTTKIVPHKYYALKFIQNHFQNHIVFNSLKGKELYCTKGYKPEKCRVIENCISSEVTVSERPPDEIIRILMVGRFNWKKDYETGIRTIGYLYNHLGIKNIRVVIAGYGVLENQIRSQIQDTGISEICEINIKPDHLQDLYRTSNIFFSSSIVEGLPNAIMEAMASGLPVVATNAGDTPRLVQEDVSGYIGEIKDYKKLAEHLKNLILNDEKRIRFGQNGQKIILKNYSFEAFKSKYIQFIQSLS